MTEQENTRLAHVMVDLETWGTGYDAMIWSIGAVKFDPLSRVPRVLEKFYVVADPTTAAHAGSIDPATVLWWMGDDLARARRDLINSDHKVDLVSALVGFAQWIGPLDLPIWANGATFDLPILGSAYKKLNLDRPWSYRAERCFRTMRALAPNVKSPESSRTAHNALDDAITQAIWLQAIASHLKLTQLD